MATAGRRGVPAGHRLHRPQPHARRGAALLPLFEVDHHQGRALARAAARRGDAVPCTRSSPTCRPSGSACCASARSREATLEGRASWWSRTMCATSSRCRACWNRKARSSRSRATAARPIEPRWTGARSARRRHRPGADGHHDAGDGRLDTAMREIRKRPTWKQAADHRAHRQGDEGRPGEVPGRRRQRLHRQAARRREAASRWCAYGCRSRRGAEPGDARSRTSRSSIARCSSRRSILKYHYDFRAYAGASMKRRLLRR